MGVKIWNFVAPASGVPAWKEGLIWEFDPEGQLRRDGVLGRNVHLGTESGRASIHFSENVGGGSGREPAEFVDDAGAGSVWECDAVRDLPVQ